MLLNVLHLNAPTGMGGSERVLLTYFENHDADLFRPYLASFVNRLRPDNDFTREAKRSGIMPRRILISGFADLHRQLLEIVGIIRELKIDIIHSHGYRSDIAGYLIARLLKIPIVSTVHGWTPITRNLRFYEQLDRV